MVLGTFFTFALNEVSDLDSLDELAVLDVLATLANLKRSRFRCLGHSGAVRSYQVHSGTL